MRNFESEEITGSSVYLKKNLLYSSTSLIQEVLSNTKVGNKKDNNTYELSKVTNTHNEIFCYFEMSYL